MVTQEMKAWIRGKATDGQVSEAHTVRTLLLDAMKEGKTNEKNSDGR